MKKLHCIVYIAGKWLYSEQYNWILWTTINILQYLAHSTVQHNVQSDHYTDWNAKPSLIECVISGNTLLEIYYHLPHYYSDSLTFRYQTVRLSMSDSQFVWHSDCQAIILSYFWAVRISVSKIFSVADCKFVSPVLQNV